MFRRRSSLGLALGLMLATTSVLAFSTPQLAQAIAIKHTAKQATGPRFAHEISDLKPDPGARFGRLKNGMGYIIYANKTPPGTAAVRFRFGAGSLNEAEDQRGLAHFLEHMAFNGSTHVPEGEMVKKLERAGLAFGADTNAFTSFDQTVYTLDLPKTDDETVDLALFLMRETAGEVLSSKDAVDKERGVVLGEERFRDTPQLRQMVDRIKHLTPGQSIGERLPIGKTEVLKNAPNTRIQDFYNAYYRPENATLIIVGDVDADKLEAKIKKLFSDWKGKGKPGLAFKPKPQAKIVPYTASIFVDPSLNETISINWVEAHDTSVETLKKDITSERESLVRQVFNRRVSILAKDPKAPFLGLGLSEGDIPSTADTLSLNIIPKPGQWEEALTLAENELRKFITFGVTDAELQREIAESRAGHKAAIASSTTRQTGEIASTLLTNVHQNGVPFSPQQGSEVFEKAIVGFDAKAAHAVIKDQFKGQGPVLLMSAPKEIPGGKDALVATYKKAASVTVKANDVVAAATWPYTQFGTPGQIVKREEIKDLGVVRATFSNGVVAQVKQTDFTKNQVLVDVRFAGGAADLPKDKSPLGVRGIGLITEGGLGKLTKTQLDEALTGKLVGAGFGLSADALSLSGSTKTEELGLEFELLTAWTTDAAYRAEPLERYKASLPLAYRNLESSAGGVFGREASALLRPNDQRVVFPKLEEAQNLTVADIKALVEPRLKTSPVEITVVGDIAPDKAFAEIARTFGALPQRGVAPQRNADARAVTFPKGNDKPVALYHSGRADQAISFIAWPTTDFRSNPRRARTLTLLADVFSNRLLEEIREKQGASYSANASSSASSDFPGYGFIAGNAMVKPEAFDTFFASAQKIAKDLGEQPATEDEFNRARKPVLEQLENSKQTNGFWLGLLSGSIADPSNLDNFRTREQDFKTITLEDLQQAAKTYLKPETAFKITVQGKTPTEGANPQTGK